VIAGGASCERCPKKTSRAPLCRAGEARTEKVRERREVNGGLRFQRLLPWFCLRFHSRYKRRYTTTECCSCRRTTSWNPAISQQVEINARCECGLGNGLSLTGLASVQSGAGSRMIRLPVRSSNSICRAPGGHQEPLSQGPLGSTSYQELHFPTRLQNSFLLGW
jgi:hypothetical protein